ncbi:hypothetical protein SAMN02745885_01625 [Carboxydocella sporoproducens DSM 16521]|uniref:Spo0E like sporulation regulatory protein n=2 Tax=Carboxydocella TaxID=178898 RepID=A0A1T4QE39_9FIRM|nr:MULTISPECIES: hypothetical protein [Carboxydocella]AVX21626.1 hypothetical protein CFE_2483 [Carboxydocella thermautotrophica]SKA01896.1 hypothetical protein SAMN02745885_01625 [Carboxydocella sporoproducens DSM 16521]
MHPLIAIAKQRKKVERLVNKYGTVQHPDVLAANAALDVMVNTYMLTAYAKGDATLAQIRQAARELGEERCGDDGKSIA